VSTVFAPRLAPSQDNAVQPDGLFDSREELAS